MASVTPPYDPDFLARPVPLPRPAGGREVRELTYPRFTVLLDPERRFAAVTAVTIDGGSLHDLERRGDWDLDPRVPAAEQAGPDVYARNDLDRGHLVRRRDPGWGTVDEARAATAATFVYTNAAPQAAAFNQSKDLWVGLEDHVLRYADANDLRVSVFTAPVLGDDDPPYRGIRIPLRFWKVAAWTTTGADGDPVLASAGFVLDQTDLVEDAQGIAAVAPLGAFRTFQAPVGDIAQLAGVDLGPLVAADTLPVPVAVTGQRWVELASPEQIRLRAAG